MFNLVIIRKNEQHMGQDKDLEKEFHLGFLGRFNEKQPPNS